MEIITPQEAIDDVPAYKIDALQTTINNTLKEVIDNETQQCKIDLSGFPDKILKMVVEAGTIAGWQVDLNGSYAVFSIKKG